jgi:hypothetical protein
MFGTVRGTRKMAARDSTSEIFSQSFSAFAVTGTSQAMSVRASP